ncbi:hypothetical protein [Streptomyces acidiscabies]|uniref:Membrane protein YndG n=1 Tax=Streptomyces acidiscabies TaxID=42234 RepID=A0A0L0KPY9_9ACTN|nr:hypothetical protein [Streptomyces acidiscabies]KND39604.1 hypothetical protein IQ63_02185 [Streptomyces acidiscabies]
MGLYIEAHIRADMDDLWTRTQTPSQHQRWDLRFTTIDYLPSAEGEPQRFRYATRVLPFVTVSGTGVTAGERERPDGTRTSALRFASPHPLSLLKEGSGYWRYVPDRDGVRFLTGYDYRPRWGWVGRCADRLLFRPLMVWATAWSFDRLRLWLEKGITPERALWNWIAELAVRVAVLATAATGLGLGPLAPYAPPLFYLIPQLLLVAACMAVFKAPLSCVPAARRCIRRAPDRARTPRLMRALETPR